MKKNICRRCGNKANISLALLNTLVNMADFVEGDENNIGNTQLRIGEPKLVKCFKCSCGHSWIPEKEIIDENYTKTSNHIHFIQVEVYNLEQQGFGSCNIVLDTSTDDFGYIEDEPVSYLHSKIVDVLKHTGLTLNEKDSSVNSVTYTLIWDSLKPKSDYIISSINSL